MEQISIVEPTKVNNAIWMMEYYLIQMYGLTVNSKYTTTFEFIRWIEIKAVTHRVLK